ncbi:MAG TPA: hypothetical protein PKH33_16060 [bacterium]|nr:hypothetical protein [bacterium]
MEEEPIVITKLAVSRLKDGDARLVGAARNVSDGNVPAYRLLVFLHDSESRVRDRLYVKLKPFAPGESQDFSLVFRLKSLEFVASDVRLEKLEGTDYSEAV